jgi:hypothetical protein
MVATVEVNEKTNLSETVEGKDIDWILRTIETVEGKDIC